ncbi:1-phosphofructokinase family hexose kinase [Mycolicibacterium neoaurum]|uniref:1-phosphofructokinase family hexose kinase n=1 Tax=Mycolicibacterium neoaurum TaxID=1795 RepID=UPI00248C79EB|nr:1-phosphofructokinase family hexose kinase [Mycolicibacterium neoaurum]WBP96353.1 1-phosphofructokinase family hexose kinase [Mycolicibacterium neoaurum]WBS10116.1 1-phosphofructokinase family hexose kinase [Mycolicibacterium neoaurum]
MTSPAIVTLTMNPALDITVDAEEVRPVDKIRCRDERRDAGGGGINVARFADVLGVRTAAVFTAGGRVGERLIELVEETGVQAIPIVVCGATREDFTVNDLTSGKQFRFVLPGPALGDAEQNRCLDALRTVAESARFVVASGSLPPGVAPDFYQRVADACTRAGVPLILDTSGGGLAHVMSGVFLLKPSVRELRECSGRDLTTTAEQVRCAHELIDRGVTQVVLVSLGARGALLVTTDGFVRFPAVPVAAVSGVGAGDAMVAGATVGLVRGWTLSRAVQYGVAAAAAKLQNPGTSAYSRDQVDCCFASVPASRESGAHRFG